MIKYCACFQFDIWKGKNYYDCYKYITQDLNEDRITLEDLK